VRIIDVYEGGCAVIIHDEDLEITFQGVVQTSGMIKRDDIPRMTGFEYLDFRSLGERIRTFLPLQRDSAQDRSMEILITFTARELNIIVAGCRATLSIIDDVDFPTITGFQRSDMERVLQEFLPLVSGEPK